MPRILIAEDPLTIMQLSGRLMDVPNVEFDVIGNGREALERISGAPGTYDLVAVGDGIAEISLTQCLTYLRQMFKELLILVLVEKESEEQMLELNNLGIRKAQVIIKPTSPERFAKMVQEELEKDRKETVEKRKRKQEGVRKGPPTG